MHTVDFIETKQVYLQKITLLENSSAFKSKFKLEGL